MTQEQNKPKLNLEPSKYKRFYEKLTLFLAQIETRFYIDPGTTLDEFEAYLDKKLEAKDEDEE